jgi:hypothetical protein
MQGHRAEAALRSAVLDLGTRQAGGVEPVSVECRHGVPWCGGGHRCTAAAGGEHRSHPHTWLTSYGTLVVTRIRRADGRDRLEVRLVAELPGEEPRDRDTARLLVLALDLVTRDVLRGRLERVREAYRRLTGVRVR